MDIVVWLRSLGLDEYEAAFRDNRINGRVLPNLTQEDLKEIGVGPVGHRRILLDAIAALRNDATGKAPSPDAATASSTRSPHPEDRAERRQVTVMFSDLVGSTALSARMDPEDLREVISAYQKCVAETVQRFGGFVAKYMGDGVLVYFGYPQAHEDDAERAVRAGLELVAAVGALKAHAPLQTRVGIATGLVVVGDLIGSGASQEQAIVGETPNLAARLQGFAEPNCVIIAQSTRKLVGNLFELEDLGAQDLKGISGPVKAWAALRPSAVESRFEAMHASGLTELVGREEEIEILLRRWSKIKTGEGQVVLLSGEAGIGKSRLTAELLERFGNESYTRIRGFCSRRHTDSAFYPIIGQMERAAALSRDDSLQAKLDKLDAVLAQSSTSAQDAALLAEMLSLPNDGRYPALELTPQQRRQRTLEALVSQIVALSRQNPVLMIFEDAHWSDPTTLELYGRIVDRIPTIRALLIVTFRPEFEPPWIGRPYATHLTINRLAEREVGAMIDGVIGNKSLPANIRQDIIERTDGVPLFVEEMTRAVLEAKDEEAAERTVAAVPSPSIAVPPSLYASLMARLDRLGSAKEVAQIGAVIGREFSHALLAAVVRKQETEIQSALDHLIEVGLLFRQGLPPHATYLFKHALVQDVAHSSLLRSTCKQLHQQIAEELEAHAPDLMESQPGLIAQHCAEAGLVEKSVAYWLEAGRRSAARSANLEAIAYLRRGIEATVGLGNGAERDRVELDLRYALGPCLIATQGPISDEARATFARAHELCERLNGPPEHLSVLYWLAAVQAVRGNLSKALEITERGIVLAEARGDRPALVNSLRGTGLGLLLMGRLVAGQNMTEHAIATFDASSDAEQRGARASGQDAGAAGLAVMSWALWALGYSDTAVARMTAALERADAIGHPHTQAYVCHYASVLHALRGEPVLANQQAERCFNLSQEHGFGHWSRPSRIVCEASRSLLDHTSDAIEAAQRDLNDLGYQMGITALYVVVSEALVLQDKSSPLTDVVAAGLETLGRTDERFLEAELYRLKARAVLARCTDDAGQTEAESLLREALATARRQGARAIELRAATSLARLWRDQGKVQQARELLTPVYGWFTEGFDTRDLKEAKALLGELG
jgi:class 3 adenylate cyclase/tetratricopeptide (TPR) repeat protein